MIRRAFASRGHFVVSVDLASAEDGAGWGKQFWSVGQHYQGDIFDFLQMGEDGDMPGQWDIFIAHPECRFLSSSGLHWNKRDPARVNKTEHAMNHAKRLWNVDIERVCLENPIGRLSKIARIEWGALVQTVQPNQFGHDASKATCLIRRALPALRQTKAISPRYVGGKKRWANQTDSGQNRLGPSPTRAQDRARTYPGIASAMAEQWGNL